MNFLELKPLTAKQLTAAVELDHLCFGGLWTKSGYERELDSPNSQLLILEGRKQNPPLTTPTPNPSKEGNRSRMAGRREKDLTSSITSVPASPLLLGLGCFWSILEEAHITILAVHPDWRHQGLGQLLLYALLRNATKCQLERATLEVKPSNQAALSIYRKFGFIEAGRRRNYYQDTGEDALILWRSGLQTPEFTATLTNFYQQLQPRLAHWNLQLSF
ncbi:MAG: ribosomal protein S18-alanine N-acetyltransferase [Symploca sp. SIO2C1]|nr:ribosomal protein S18-alanine N-acetyltransferase [Symploca sp. SIO2C1]